MILFKEKINDWMSWFNIKKSINVFKALIEYIYIKHNLYFTEIEHLTAGTNAIFKIGQTVLKIFAPNESGINSQSDFNTEKFGLIYANSLGLSVPKLLASGCINDKYEFFYLVMDYIDSKTIGDIECNLSSDEKEAVAEKIRKLTNKLNKPCKSFNHIGIIERELNNERWNILPNSFNNERIDYLKSIKLKNVVYVHGDLNPDNLLLNNDGEVFIIDFADAILAPSEYELASIICQLFCFEKPYIKGYFKAEVNNVEMLTEKCFKGVIIHDFGADIIKSNFGQMDEITNFAILRERIYLSILNGKGYGEIES